MGNIKTYRVYIGKWYNIFMVNKKETMYDK